MKFGLLAVGLLGFVMLAACVNIEREPLIKGTVYQPGGTVGASNCLLVLRTYGGCFQTGSWGNSGTDCAGGIGDRYGISDDSGRFAIPAATFVAILDPRRTPFLTLQRAWCTGGHYWEYDMEPRVDFSDPDDVRVELRPYHSRKNIPRNTFITLQRFLDDSATPEIQQEDWEKLLLMMEQAYSIPPHPDERLASDEPWIRELELRIRARMANK